MRNLALALAFAVAAAPLGAQETTEPKPDAPKADAPVTPPTPAGDVPAPSAATTDTLPIVATGTLSLTSTPPGKVFIDDKDTGLTTPVTDLLVAGGKHTVKIVADDGRETSSEFMLEAGGSLSLNLNLPEAAVPATGDAKPADTTQTPGDAATGPTTTDVKPADTVATDVAPPADDWSWMTVSGWTGLGLGTIGLLSGAVVLTTPTDPDQGPLGFGLFGAGVGMVLGGAVLLYLDNELTDSAPPAAAAAR